MNIKNTVGLNVILSNARMDVNILIEFDIKESIDFHRASEWFTYQRLRDRDRERERVTRRRMNSNIDLTLKIVPHSFH